MTEYKEAHMVLAAEEAIKTVNARAGTPFGAALVSKDTGAVVATGANTVYATHDPTCHAETNAIRVACAARKSTDLSDCVMYATGEPCPMCKGLMALCRVPVCYYASSYADAGAHGYGCDHVVAAVAHGDQTAMKWNKVDGCAKVAELWALDDSLKKQ